jgi:hypothetical protein
MVVNFNLTDRRSASRNQFQPTVGQTLARVKRLGTNQ